MKKVPNVKLRTWKGKDLELADYKDKKVWLAFFRYASCPLCNLRVHEMIQRHEELEKKGIQILAVFQSDEKSIAKHVGRQNPPFPLIADPEEKLYDKFGLKKGLWAFLNPFNMPILFEAMFKGFKGLNPEGTITRIPGDFLINPGLTLDTEYHGKKIGDHIQWSEVERFAAN